jgi:hypothetical protein
MSMSKEMSMPGQHGGHLYMQTNEIRNAIIHYSRSANGMITEVERIPTGSAGSGTFKPISGQDSAPNSFEGAGSLVLTPDRRFLFAANGGDNSVSSFGVGDDGAGSRCWTARRRETRSREGAAPPSRWPMPPRAARFLCCTRSAPTTFG